MASSDEEGEILPQCVTNYYLVSNIGTPVSLAILPLQLKDGEGSESCNEQVFLRGTVDSGTEATFKEIIAWKFELSYVHPEISVLSKSKIWIQLQKPRRSYQDIVRSILVTVHLLHLAKKSPEASATSLWNSLCLLKLFSTFEEGPSENDVWRHTNLISAALSVDKDLVASKYLLNILKRSYGKEVTSFEKAVPTARKQIFIVDADDSDGEDHEDCEDDMDFDRVCSFCDDGGMLLCCDGRCMRSFHATKEDGIATNCESLGLTDVHVKAMTSFQCQNCKSQRHQCFACGLLGSSDVASGAEVFPCISATCGHFYHPVCVAKLIHPEDATKAAVLQNQIATGESFTCPAHRCSACKKLEDKTFHELQFAICRRCPTSYHRKCMPKKHKVNPELKTPERNHILFSDTQRSGMKNTSQLSGRMKNIGDSKKILLQKIGSKMSKPVDLTSKNVERGFSQACSGASKSLNISVAKHPSNYSGILPKEQWSGTDARGCLSASSALVEELLRRNSEPRHKQGTDTGKIRIKNTEMMRKSSSWSNSAAMEERMAAFKKKCDASFDEKKFRSKMSVVSTHSSNPRNMLDKAITQGRMDASVKAVREALRKLEEGGTLEEAKAICEPRILNQIVTWQRKLRVYLAPFLHGMRYTSYGRHFTKFEKLQEVVHRLHHYVLDGDTIVDFCCGSNDFSLLMKKKLNEMGKCCSFRNYDIIQPKNDFCFEKRDWMSVTPKELPTGSKLIMGLNPPFGVKASLANKFINKALEFNPKLIILIVPEETKRLDDNYAYDLIWEDRKILSGKSFYLPGSIDVHNKQIEQWNNSPPPLYLWSRSDWSNNHRSIATKHGHLFMMQGEANAQHDSGVPTTISNYLMEESNDCYGDFSDIMPVDITKILDDISDPEYSNESEPDEVCENKRKYNNSSEDTELSGGESSLLVKKRPPFTPVFSPLLPPLAPPPSFPCLSTVPPSFFLFSAHNFVLLWKFVMFRFAAGVA
ncbi:hypothetical protein QQ045_009493 [Rhodiola kirilowii]